MLKVVKEVSWGLLLVVIIFGGIYGGIFILIEVVVVVVVYFFFIVNFIYCDMGLFVDKINIKLVLVKVVEIFVYKDIKVILYDVGKLIIMLMFIIVNVFILKYVFIEECIL